MISSSDTSPESHTTIMETRLIPARLQVFFWTIIIRLISESRLAQSCLQQLYQLKDTNTAALIRVSLVFLGAGLLFGILLGLVGV